MAVGREYGPQGHSRYLERDSFADSGATSPTPPGLAIPSRAEMTVCIQTANRFREISGRVDNFTTGIDGLVRRLHGSLPGDNAARVGPTDDKVPVAQSGLSEIDQAHTLAIQSLEQMETALQQLFELNLA